VFTAGRASDLGPQLRTAAYCALLQVNLIPCHSLKIIAIQCHSACMCMFPALHGNAHTCMFPAMHRTPACDAASWPTHAPTLIAASMQREGHRRTPTTRRWRRWRACVLRTSSWQSGTTASGGRATTLLWTAPTTASCCPSGGALSSLFANCVVANHQVGHVTASHPLPRAVHQVVVAVRAVVQQPARVRIQAMMLYVSSPNMSSTIAQLAKCKRCSAISGFHLQ